MPKTKDQSPLVGAAAALENETRGFADLASQTKREPLDNDRSMTRTTRALADSVQYHARIEEKLKALVAAIDGVRQRQQESVETLVKVAHDLEVRAKSRDGLLARFAELGGNAAHVNTLAQELSTRRSEGAESTEVLDRLTALEASMDAAVSEAQAIAQTATADGWPEIARQAEGVRQQMQSAKNKLALAHRNVAGSAPS